MKRTLLTVMTAGCLAALVAPAAPRKWTSSDGHFSTEAELVASADGTVTLKKSNGAVVSVPIESLSPADRRFLAALKAKSPSYSADVKPLLAKYCMECHNSNKAKAGYSVEGFDALTRPGKKGPLVVPGDPAQSRLISDLQGKGKPMPPRRSRQPTAAEIKKVVEWVEAGARDDTAGL